MTKVYILRGQLPVIATLRLLPSAMLLPRHWSCLLLSLLVFAVQNVVSAFEVPVSDTDYDRQICSGMWGGKNTYINGVHGLPAAQITPAECSPTSDFRRLFNRTARHSHL